MKNFIKLFFIVSCFFISLAVNATEIDYGAINYTQHGIVNTISIPDEELGIKPSDNETEFVAANAQTNELSAPNDRRNNFSGGNIDKTSAQNKLLQKIFSSNYNKTFYSTSHKISSYLKNEICTRAP